MEIQILNQNELNKHLNCFTQNNDSLTLVAVVVPVGATSNNEYFSLPSVFSICETFLLHP